MHLLILAATAAIALNSNTLDRTACQPRVERIAVLMGTSLRVTACHTDRDRASAAIEAGFQEVARLEQILSSWTESTNTFRWAARQQ